MSLAVLGVTIGVAMLKYRLYDIDLVISRTLVYGALAVCITATYVAVVVGLGALVGTRGEANPSTGSGQALVLSLLARSDS